MTVYRLIIKGTVEDRILQRANQKSDIQRMVITGGQFQPKDLKANEVVAMLLDDDEAEKKCKTDLMLCRCMSVIRHMID